MKLSEIDMMMRNITDQIEEIKEYTKEGDINSIFRQIKAKGIGKTD